MFAIIRSGGKQYRVTEGERLLVERDVLGNAEKDKVTFEEVLMIGGDKPKVGSPTINGATVSATILRESRGHKIVVFRKKRRKNHTKRTHGHRQDMVELRIDRFTGRIPQLAVVLVSHGQVQPVGASFGEHVVERLRQVQIGLELVQIEIEIRSLVRG